MARLWSSGFELNSVTAGVELTFIVGSPTISTTTVRSGTYALRSLNGTAGFRHNFAATNQTAAFYARGYVRFATLPNADVNLFAFRNVTPSGKITARFVTADSTIILYNIEDSAQIGTGSLVVTTGQWYRIELQIDTTTISSTTATLRIDGTQIETGTVNLATGVGELLVQGGGTTSDVFWDDIAINDSTGSFQNSYPGEGNIIHLRPDAAGDNAGWDIEAGITFAEVDEVTPDDVTTIIAASVIDRISDFRIDAPTIESTDVINCVQVGVRYGYGGAIGGAPAFVTRIKASSGGTVDESSSITIATNADYRTNAVANPRNYALTLYDLPGASTTAWTMADLNSAQIGVKSSDGDGDTKVSTLWLLVDYVRGEHAGFIQNSLRPAIFTPGMAR